MQTPGSILTRHPSALLLAAQLAAVCLYPFVGDTRAGHGLLAAIGTVVIFLALAVVRSSTASNWVAVLLGVPAVLLSAAEIVAHENTAIVTASALVHAPFYLYVAYGLVAYLFGDDRVTTDELFASGAAFTVLAWAFAYVDVAVQALWPGSFSGPGDDPRTWFELLFLSFSTLTSVGLSDIIPTGGQARAVAMLEMFAGVMYLALVVSRLVGMHISRAGR